MGLHSFIEYIKYRRRAKGRHGVHSPFVFEFIEKVLRDKSDIPFQKKLTHHFIGQKVFMYHNMPPVEWGKDKAADVIVVIKGIHKIRAFTERWNELYADKAVTLSIDIFGYGLLFFNPDFKEKQHFVLKYPA